MVAHCVPCFLILFLLITYPGDGPVHQEMGPLWRCVIREPQPLNGFKGLGVRRGLGEAGGTPDLGKLPKSGLRNRKSTTTKQLHKYLSSGCDKPGAKLMPVYT